LPQCTATQILISLGKHENRGEETNLKEKNKPQTTHPQRTSTRWSRAQCAHDHAGFPAGPTWPLFWYIQWLL